MNEDLKAAAASGLKKTWCSTWTFAVNTGRRVKILGRKGLGYWQQRKIDKALAKLGDHTFQALEQGETNPLMAPGVNDAVQKAKDLKYIKEKNYLAIQAIRETDSVFLRHPHPRRTRRRRGKPGSTVRQ